MKCLKKRMDHIIAAALPVLACFLLTAMTSAQVWDRQSFEGGANIEIIPESVQVDSLGRIHIVHMIDDMLIYNRFDGTGWIREIIPAGARCTSPYRDPSFEFCLDPHDVPHIGYCANNEYFHLVRDEEGWKTSDKGYGLYDIDGNAHYTYRLWDDWLGCDYIYHHGPEGTEKLELCYWDDSDFIDMIALRKDRYPTVIYVDCDGCTNQSLLVYR